MRISVVMPAYNEKDNIKRTVRNVHHILKEYSEQPEIVVVDDGSSDETFDILKELQQDENIGLVVKKNSSNEGYGVALTKAFQASTGEIVVSIDSDGQFDISDMGVLLPLLDSDTDIVSGYRTAKKDSRLKVIADRMMNLLIRLLFQVSFKDTNCALKIYKGDVIRSMSLEASGFQLPTEIMLKADALGLSVKEAPVHHRIREGGCSALAPFKTAWRMFVFLIYLRMKIALYKHRVIRRL